MISDFGCGFFFSWIVTSFVTLRISHSHSRFILIIVVIM